MSLHSLASDPKQVNVCFGGIHTWMETEEEEEEEEGDGADSLPKL